MRRRSWLFGVVGLAVILLVGWGCSGWLSSPAASAPADASAPEMETSASGDYEIGDPILADLWVDPANGDDNRNGSSRGQALRTIRAAWGRIPASAPLTGTGYRIQLAAGDYPEGTFPVYWEDRHGAAQFPIILNSADGTGAARLNGMVNVFNVDYLYLIGLEMHNDGDIFHCERCTYLLIRNVHMDGGDRLAWETFKANQSQHIYIEESDIHGAQDNAVDFVAVQYGHLRRNRIHNAADWCAYVKGGSAYITVEGNEIFDCGTGGFTAGQGTGFEFMESPWLHYEAYAVKVANNVIHDTEGAGLGVNGGYQILMAYNTLYRVGGRSHLLEAVFGLRTCDGNTDACAQRNQRGGWGTSISGYDGEQPIPNRDVFIVNNLIVNPDGYRSGWQHFAIYPPRTPGDGSNIPNSALTDDNLQIRGNVLWNGPADWPLGVGEDSGCLPANPTCNAAQLVADNAINTVEPIFVDAVDGNFRVSNAGTLPTPVALPPFSAWHEFTPAVPASSFGNNILTDRDGRARADHDLVGAYTLPGAPLPGDESTVTPTSTPLSDQTNASYLPLLSGQRAEIATATPSPTATSTATLTNTPSPTPTPTATDQNGTIPSGPLTLVTLGDSLTEGERDDSAQGGGYPRRLLEAVGAQRPGSTLLNLGRSGWTSGDLINGVNGEAGQLGQAVAYLNHASGAKMALVWIGSNDLWYLYEFGPEPMTDDAETQNLAKYETNLTAIVQQLRATGAVVLLGLMDDQSLRPVVADPPNPGEPAFPSISADDRTRMSAQVGRYNSVLTTLAAAPAVDEVDFFNTTIFTDPATLADDGNHPNATGYDAIMALWWAAIQRTR